MMTRAATGTATGSMMSSPPDIGNAAGRLRLATGRLDLAPSDAAAWRGAAEAYRALGNRRAAIACWRRALELGGAPDVKAALGAELNAAGDLAAVAALDAAALPAGDARPPGPEVQARLAALAHEADLLRRAGRRRESFALHREALALAPGLAGIWMSAGFLLVEDGIDNAVALPYFETAARLEPTLYGAVEMARRICAAAGLEARARDYTARAAALEPTRPMALAGAQILPALYESREAIAECRARYAAALAAAGSQTQPIEPFDTTLCVGAFFLAYHGENDRDLQRAAAQLYLACVPSLGYRSPRALPRRAPAARIRVGFISRFLYSHSIGRTTRGLVEGLDRTRFEVLVLRIPRVVDDPVARAIAAAADRTVDLPADLAAARAAIEALDLDVLFYQDIGMEPFSYLLALARLAPVQCVSYGHPNTTGLPEMDYFVSSDAYEVDGAEAHYSERLFRLAPLPTLAYYHRPAAPGPLPARVAFGLSAAEHVYACPQSLFKLHPDIDDLFGGILSADPAAVIVLIRSTYADYVAQLSARFSRALGPRAARIRFIDPLPGLSFLQFLALADVVLDTPHFNGMNTSLEAFSVGTPVITLPGALQRSRHTRAMYLAMGIDDGIATDAADYVRRAVALGTDPGAAQALRARILERNPVLYDNPAVLREFERFFTAAVAAVGASVDAAPGEGPSPVGAVVEGGAATYYGV